MTPEIKTPQTDPNHATIGHHFGGYSYKSRQTEIYFCDSYDRRIGFWLTNVRDDADRINVSERAIGRTFHEAEDRKDHWWITSWSKRVPKS